MADERLLDYNPETGMREWYSYDAETDTGFIRYEQDVSGILDFNKALRAEGRSFYAKDKDKWHAASIPPSVQMKWLVEKGVDVFNEDHKEAVRKLLNDPEWAYLKRADIII